ncbi:hypothetical protein V8E55_007879 [Tylopilus felleus]
MILNFVRPQLEAAKQSGSSSVRRYEWKGYKYVLSNCLRLRSPSSTPSQLSTCSAMTEVAMIRGASTLSLMVILVAAQLEFPETIPSGLYPMTPGATEWVTRWNMLSYRINARMARETILGNHFKFGMVPFIYSQLSLWGCRRHGNTCYSDRMLRRLFGTFSHCDTVPLAELWSSLPVGRRCRHSRGVANREAGMVGLPHQNTELDQNGNQHADLFLGSLGIVQKAVRGSRLS